MLTGSWGGNVFFDPTNGSIAYALLSYGFLRTSDTANGIWKSVDGGLTWSELTLKAGAAPYLWHETMAMVPGSPQTLLAFAYDWSSLDSHQLFFKGTDGGQNWTQVASLSGYFFCDRTWTDISGDLPNTPVRALVVDPALTGTFYIGADEGVLVTRNGGLNWQRLGQGLPRVRVSDLKLHVATRTLRAATYGRGMWDLVLPDH